MDTFISYDQAHVLLDALDAHIGSAAVSRPWENYGADPAGDPKSSEAGYRALLAEVREPLVAIVAGNPAAR